MMISALGSGVLLQPIVNYLEIISLGKTFSQKNGYVIDPTQEFVALGMTNFVNSFVGAFPISGGMSRTAVNYQANAATLMSGIISKFQFQPVFIFRHQLTRQWR